MSELWHFGFDFVGDKCYTCYNKKERWSNMTTLTHTHTPYIEAISEVSETQYTFCTECENNIERFWIEDEDRLPMWSEWRVSL